MIISRDSQYASENMHNYIVISAINLYYFGKDKYKKSFTNKVFYCTIAVVIL